MSKHLIEINFDQLKFNLYDLLGVSTDSTAKKIKKAFRSLIVKFHPDKNDVIDDEIYNHLTISNQVLTNDELRKKYDDWLKSFEVNQSHESLKDKSQNYVDNHHDKKTNYSYEHIENQLNKKHGFTEDYKLPMDENIYNKKFSDIKNEMKNLGLETINKEEFRGSNDFNSKFSNRKVDGHLKNQIIKVDKQSEIMELNNRDIGNKFLSINNYEMLYSNDGVDTQDYSSLEQGFGLLPNENDLKSNRNRSNNSFSSYVEDYKKEGDIILKKETGNII
jgi:curved DNA-binding protein CbpA